MHRQIGRKVVSALALGLGMSIAASAGAAVITTVHFDINDLSIAATGAGGFSGTNYSGTLTLSQNGNTKLVGIDEYDTANNGYSETISTGTPSITALSGTINISSGSITGGSLSFTVQNADTSLHTYTGTIVSYPGVDVQSPSPYYMSEELDPTAMDSNYAGVDTSLWSTDLPADVGSFLLSNVFPGASQTEGQLEVYVVVPEPVSLGLAGMGLMALLPLRRRRA